MTLHFIEYSVNTANHNVRCFIIFSPNLMPAKHLKNLEQAHVYHCVQLRRSVTVVLEDIGFTLLLDIGLQLLNSPLSNV